MFPYPPTLLLLAAQHLDSASFARQPSHLQETNKHTRQTTHMNRFEKNDEDKRKPHNLRTQHPTSQKLQAFRFSSKT